jgi:hypothetical protein
MNSMYGRFGMHTDAIRQALMDSEQLKDLAKYYIIKGEIPLGELILVTLSKS